MPSKQEILKALDNRPSRGRQPALDPESTRARTNALSAANFDALRALKSLHPDDFDVLIAEARKRRLENAGFTA